MSLENYSNEYLSRRIEHALANSTIDENELGCRRYDGYHLTGIPRIGLNSAGTQKVCYLPRVVGHVPMDLTASHDCGNRWCVNPDHIHSEPHWYNVWRNACQKLGLHTAETCPHEPKCRVFRRCEDYNHHIEFSITTDDTLRMIANTRPEYNCLIWCGALSSGRPVIGNLYCSRAAAMAAWGPPEHLWYQASHLCHNKLCVSPMHIIWETPWDNKKRDLCVKAGRCICGLRHSCLL